MRKRPFDAQPQDDGKPPWTPTCAGRDWPSVPVPVWDVALEAGVWALLQGDWRATRAARNTLAAVYGSLEVALGRWRAMVNAAPDHLPGIMHPAGVTHWKRIGDYDERAAEHWAHVRGHAHARYDGLPPVSHVDQDTGMIWRTGLDTPD